MILVPQRMQEAGVCAEKEGERGPLRVARHSATERGEQAPLWGRRVRHGRDLLESTVARLHHTHTHPSQVLGNNMMKSVIGMGAEMIGC